jgi:plastocyanin
MASNKNRDKGRFAPFILPLIVFLALLPVAIVLGIRTIGGNGSKDPELSPTVTASPFPDGDVVPIRVVDFAFEPGEATAANGQLVVFQNVSPSMHSIRIVGTDAELPLERGSVAEWEPTEPGEYRYVCSIHPNLMSGTITVTAN